ncbi:MAG: GNAT family N-acetyltransferase [Planctomycetes bacterium]|nr:GNAT family N-acetyltransferase [Planctomycetota bacterium]
MLPAQHLTLRPFCESDAAVIEPWLQEPGLSLPPGLARRIWARRLVADRGILARVGVVKGVVLGFGRLDCGPDRVAELTLVVAPGHRRQGLGRQVLEGLLTEARGRGICRVQAMVDPGNRQALEFFAGQSFEQESGHGVGARLRLVRLVHAGDHREPLEIEV